MTNPLRTRAAIAAFAGLSLIGVLAGCSSTASTDASSTGVSSSSSSSSAATPSSSATSSSTSSGTSATSTSANTTTYKDGTYTANGSYSSPGGREEISVSLTISDDTVKAVTVKTVTADATAREYQEEFENGISAAVVGKKLSTLSVSRVAGSSLTSQGFNAAVTTIKSDATS